MGKESRQAAIRMSSLLNSEVIANLEAAIGQERAYDVVFDSLINALSLAADHEFDDQENEDLDRACRGYSEYLLADSRRSLFGDDADWLERVQQVLFCLAKLENCPLAETRRLFLDELVGIWLRRESLTTARAAAVCLLHLDFGPKGNKLIDAVLRKLTTEMETERLAWEISEYSGGSSGPANERIATLLKGLARHRAGVRLLAGGLKRSLIIREVERAVQELKSGNSTVCGRTCSFSVDRSFDDWQRDPHLLPLGLSFRDSELQVRVNINLVHPPTTWKMSDDDLFEIVHEFLHSHPFMVQLADLAKRFRLRALVCVSCQGKLSTRRIKA